MSASPAGDSPNKTSTRGDELAARTDAIEAGYEFFLAYAAQGLPNESSSGAQVRQYLTAFEQAVDGLGPFFLGYIESLGLHAASFNGFIDVIERDARDTLAAVHMVLAHPSISSQIIDNLNANIHVRALLTDLFLIDEVLKNR